MEDGHDDDGHHHHEAPPAAYDDASNQPNSPLKHDRDEFDHSQHNVAYQPHTSYAPSSNNSSTP
ncbi:hypothetical protein, partial [Sporisorium scitamineum]